ncbi:MAG: hydrolase [Candidatus Saccharibacteria bacterium]|nr:hydrolase [Candidatus Saccharibacteria bacterium]
MTKPVITKIIHDISQIKPIDGLETNHINDALAWIESTDNIFRIKKPDVPPKHLVSYFVLIDPDHKSILLADHIKAQLWLPSGGHVEKDEDPAETVKRECIEELNIPAVFLKNKQLPFFITVTQTVGLTAGHTDVSLWYLIKGDKFKYLNYDRSEFNDVEWWTFDEILESNPTIFDPHMQRFTRKLMNENII